MRQGQVGDSKEENFWGLLQLFFTPKKSELYDTGLALRSFSVFWVNWCPRRPPCGPVLPLDMQSVSEMAELTLRFANNFTAEE